MLVVNSLFFTTSKIESFKIPDIGTLSFSSSINLILLVLRLYSIVYLSEKLGMSYQYLSSLFSSTEGITIEKYIINQKIEKVKELIVYDELTLSEIAYRLGYSSVQHLSNQFKRVTGFTPSDFKKLKVKPRKTLDDIS